MITDPARRGRALAELYLRLAPRLFDEILESGLLPGPDAPTDAARTEWGCFALYACVRGLVAAGGFHPETVGPLHAPPQAALQPRAPPSRPLAPQRHAQYPP